jgi:tRNA pseudouridine38-40 synthase
VSGISRLTDVMTTDEMTGAVRYRLDIAYDGSGFHGWGRQPGTRTVQGVLEDALETVLRRHPPAPRLVVAGRTDAGVHALGQVAHVDLLPDQERALVRRRGRPAVPAGPTSAPPDPNGAGAETGGDTVGRALALRLNGVLGLSSDVVVSSAARAPAGFDARFSAVWRRYEYRIADNLSPHDPLQRHRTARIAARLDGAAMDEAARALVGLHDFAAYCRPREGSTTIRTLQQFGWRRDHEGVLIATVKADAFCHSMVRALVGACVAVGEGKLSAEDLVGLRDAAVRTSAFVVMPANGLTLIEVGYPADSALAARAEQTRALRTLQPR